MFLSQSVLGQGKGQTITLWNYTLSYNDEHSKRYANHSAGHNFVK